MRQLKTLLLNFNRVAELPTNSFSHLHALKALQLEGNPLRKPPLEFVLEHGAAGIQAWGDKEVESILVRRQKAAVDMFLAYSLVKKLVPLDAMSSLTVEAAVLTPVAVIGLGVIAGRGDLSFGSDGLGLSLLLVSAGIVTVVPLLCFGAAARLVPLSLLGLMQYLTPTLQFLCGVVVFRESVTAARWVGFSLVWLALCVLTWDMVRFTRQRRPVDAPPDVVPTVSAGD